MLFDHEQGVEPCTNPNIDHIAKRYGVDGCSMCSSAGLALGMPNQTAKDYLVNDDQKVILNYWSTPKIQIGLKNGPSTLAWSANGNTYEFLPTLTPYQCNNWNPTILLSTLSLLPGNEYEVLKPIDVNGTLYPANSLFYIEIKVKFENGLEIDRKECITVPVPTSYTTVQLFSRVKNFDSNITNYQIKVYQ